MHIGERAVIAGGLIGGLLVGVLLFKGGISAGKTAAVVVAVPATSPSADALSPDPEVEALKQRIAVLEKKRLARRLAELEAETEESAEIDDSQAGRQEHPALPTRGPAVASVVPRREAPPESGVEKSARGKSKRPAKRRCGTAGGKALRGTGDPRLLERAERRHRAGIGDARPARECDGSQCRRIRAGAMEGRSVRLRSAGALDAGGVDPEALQLGRELMAWYREEVTLNERATSLLGSASAADRKGAAGNSWRSGEEQHRRKCEEINRHGARSDRACAQVRLGVPPAQLIAERACAQPSSAVTDSGDPTGPMDW